MTIWENSQSNLSRTLLTCYKYEAVKMNFHFIADQCRIPRHFFACELKFELKSFIISRLPGHRFPLKLGGRGGGWGTGYSSVCIYVKKMFEVRRIIPTIREKYKSYEEINSYLKFNT